MSSLKTVVIHLLNYHFVGNPLLTTGVPSAAVMESSAKDVSRGFYQALRESLSFGKSRPEGSNATAIQDKLQERSLIGVDVTESFSNVQKSPGSKPKSKYGKKKEIVSSSTVVPRVEVCTGKKCRAKGSDALLTEFQTASDGRVEIAYTKCMKECKQGMNARVTKNGTTFEWHHEVSTENVEPILCKHFEW